jgi:hypothetical protein
MKLSLHFLPVAEEVTRKLESMMKPADGPLAEFMSLLDERLNSAVPLVRQTLDRLDHLPSISPDHPSMRAYLSHPIRVAHAVLATMREPSADAVLTALLHNLFELSGLNEDDLQQWGLPQSVAAQIRLLTIDRNRESDIDYLGSFYGAIETAGEELTLVRCMDKLDNLLGSQTIENPKFRVEYIELADRFLTPMALRIDTAFGEYFSATCAFARYAPYLPEVRKRINFLVTRGVRNV